MSLVLSLLASGCGPSLVPALPDRASAPEFYAPTLEGEYRVQIGDGLALRSYYDPQLSQEVVVRPDGRVSLLLLGDRRVVGRTLRELDAEFTADYRELVPSADITISLSQASGMSVYLGGEVRLPSQQPLHGSLTILQAITMAGGFLDTAQKTQVLLLRKQADGNFRVYELDVEKILAYEAPEVYLNRYDIVYVPKSKIAEANLYVEQYINRMVPRAILVNFGWIRQSGNLSVD